MNISLLTCILFLYASGFNDWFIDAQHDLLAAYPSNGKGQEEAPCIYIVLFVLYAISSRPVPCRIISIF